MWSPRAFLIWVLFLTLAAACAHVATPQDPQDLIFELRYIGNRGDRAKRELTKLGAKAVPYLVRTLRDIDPLKVSHSTGYEMVTRSENRFGFRNGNPYLHLGSSQSLERVERKDISSFITFQSAVSVLQSIGEPSVLPLVELLANQQSESYSDRNRTYHVRCEVAKVLGRLRDKRAIEVLVQSVEDDRRWGISKCAKEALSYIGWEASVEIERAKQALVTEIADNKATPETVAHYLEKGAPVDSKSDDGETLLLLAIRKRNPDITSLLLSKSADVSATDRYGRTPLMFAAYLGDLDLIGRLLSAGANVGSVDDDHNDALIYAARKGRSDVVRLLLEHQANPASKNTQGLTPLMYAAGGRVTENLASTSFSELMGYRNYGDEATVITLLSRGVNVNECDNDGRTALMYAAAVGNLSVVMCLLSANADLTIRDSKGKTAAEIAKKRYNLSVFKLLTEASAR